MIPGRRVNWAARNELGCEVLGHAAEKANRAAGTSWAARRTWARSQEGKRREKKFFLLFSKELTNLNSNK
jgi:hypothetical protein